MKVLTKLKLNDVHELSSHEMKWMKGGASVGEYCCGLYNNAASNYNNWSAGAQEGFWYGYSLCMDAGFGDGGTDC